MTLTDFIEGGSFTYGKRIQRGRIADRNLLYRHHQIRQ